jgi:hypothetical protein
MFAQYAMLSLNSTDTQVLPEKFTSIPLTYRPMFDFTVPVLIASVILSRSSPGSGLNGPRILSSPEIFL